MRRKQTRKSTQIMVFDKEENKFTNAFTLPSILSEFKLCRHLTTDSNTPPAD